MHPRAFCAATGTFSHATPKNEASVNLCWFLIRSPRVVGAAPNLVGGWLFTAKASDRIPQHAVALGTYQSLVCGESLGIQRLSLEDHELGDQHTVDRCVIDFAGEGRRER